MKTKLALTFVLLYSFHMSLYAEDYVATGTATYDVPVDARSIAMGESFTAVWGNPKALMYNPSGLASFQGADATFSIRRMDWTSYTHDFRYYNASLAIATPIGTVGLLYNRFVSGELRIISPQFPEGVGKMKLFDHTLVVGFGKTFGENWDIGVALKMFDEGYTTISGDVPNTTTSPAFLVDCGFIFHAQLPFESDLFCHTFAIGASAQNVGGKLKGRQVYSSAETNYEVILPQYLRFGVTYSATVRNKNDESLDPLSVLVSGEYRTFTNGLESQAGYKDYWGFGAEVTAFEIFSMRLSGFIQPHASIYGLRGNPALRYGLGLSLPLHKLDSSFPMIIQIDCAGIPPIGSLQPTTMRAFTVSLRYVNELF